MKTYVLFNPASGNGTGERKAHELDAILKNEELLYFNITKSDYAKLVASVSQKDKIIICGGDGTLNSFINKIDTENIKPAVYLYPSGSGNDFLLDLGLSNTKEPVNITKYIKNLPVISVNGKTYKFINGAGAGIDGYACDECNRIRQVKKRKVSYVGVALKGILYSFKPLSGTVTIDGKEHFYKNMWLTPVMKGKFCGGGLMLAPDQERSSDTLSFITAHSVSRLKLLTILPTAFSGKHVRYKKYVDVIKGRKISVKFDRPTTLQIDGETFKDVSEFDVSLTGAAAVI